VRRQSQTKRRYRARLPEKEPNARVQVPIVRAEDHRDVLVAGAPVSCTCREEVTRILDEAVDAKDMHNTLREWVNTKPGTIDVLVCGKCGHIYSLAEVNARKYDHHLCLLCGSHELRTEKL